MTVEPLYEDEEIVVVRRPGDSPFTLVTFADLTARPKPGYFWGLQPAERLGLDCIGFIARRENWYPAASVARCAEVVRRVAKPERIGYGYSMGGYAALKYGRLLGLTRALAISPQFSIDPADVPWDRLYRSHFQPELHPAMRVKASELAPWAAVVADPWHPDDGAHLRCLERLEGVFPVVAPFLGHSAFWLFAGTAALDQALRRVLDADAAGLRRLLRAWRGGSAVWCHIVGGAALCSGRGALAERLWERAAALGVQPAVLRKGRAEALLARATRLRGAGRRSEATAAARLAAAALPDDPKVLIQAGQFLLLLGDAAGAEPLFIDALALTGERNATAHICLSESLARQGRATEALEAARRGATLLPGEPRMTQKLQALVARFGAP